jgi:hypothetical protein
MRLEWLELRDFRNHPLTAVDHIPEGLIVVVGPNGEGKTNLLEGMFFLYSLRSPRTSTNAPLVREGAEVGYARGEFDGNEGRALVEVEIPRKGASRVKLNKSPIRRKRELRRQVRAVLFGPFDLPVVIGDPSKRRDLMDEALVAIWPLKDGVSSAYDRALRQRNRLLKEWEGGRGGPPGMDAWDEELIRTGVPLIEARNGAVSRVVTGASTEFEALSGYELLVTYAPNVAGSGSVEESFREQLAARRGGGAGPARPRRRSVSNWPRADPTSSSAGRRSSARTATTSPWPSATSAPEPSVRTVRRGPRPCVFASASRRRSRRRPASHRCCSSTIRSVPSIRAAAIASRSGSRSEVGRS